MNSDARKRAAEAQANHIGVIPQDDAASAGEPAKNRSHDNSGTEGLSRSELIDRLEAAEDLARSVEAELGTLLRTERTATDMGMETTNMLVRRHEATIRAARKLVVDAEANGLLAIPRDELKAALGEGL